MITTSQNVEKITLVTVCDSHYLILLAALIKSIEANHHTGEILDLYIVYDNVNKTNRDKLERSVNKSITNVTWLNMAEVVPENLVLPSDGSSYPINIYMRIFIPYFVPREISKVIYLDVDMIVLADICELWKVDIGNSPIAAVLDSRIKTFDNSWGGVKNYQQLGISGDTQYFNTGLLLFNTEEWLKLEIAQQVIDCVQQNRSFLNYPDQYALNVVLADRWYKLHPDWNYFSDAPDQHCPNLIHFIERKPIYKSYNNSKVFQDIFFSYLKQTEWKKSAPVSEFSRYIKKLMNVVKKKLPF